MMGSCVWLSVAMFWVGLCVLMAGIRVGEELMRYRHERQP